MLCLLSDSPMSREDFANTIRIHNCNNESAWEELMKWEKAFHSAECPSGPRLKGFYERAYELTPKAKIFNDIGLGRPYDTHDWIIDRCGKEIRYHVEYYDAGEAQTGQFARVAVRPAMDSFENIWDRMKAVCWGIAVRVKNSVRI